MTTHRLLERPRIPAATALVLMTAVCAALPARASTVSINGDTTGAPTFQRPVQDLSALSAIGTAAHHTAYGFTVAVSGIYSFTTSGNFDTFVLLYDTAFVPTAALLNALIANDDLGASFSTSGFAFGLVAGRQYTYVVTGFDNQEFGTYTTTIAAPPVALVDEPATWALAALGLVAALRRRGAAA